jgi:amino acid transporter
MTLKNQYLLAALCCTIGCVFLFVQQNFNNFGPIFLAAGIIFPRLRRLANPGKQKTIKTKEVKQATLANLVLLLVILWVFIYTLIKKSDMQVVFGGWGFMALLWLFFMSYLYKNYLVEEAEMKKQAENPEADKTGNKN